MDAYCEAWLGSNAETVASHVSTKIWCLKNFVCDFYTLFCPTISLNLYPMPMMTFGSLHMHCTVYKYNVLINNNTSHESWPHIPNSCPRYIVLASKYRKYFYIMYFTVFKIIIMNKAHYKEDYTGIYCIIFVDFRTQNWHYCPVLRNYVQKIYIFL